WRACRRLTRRSADDFPFSGLLAFWGWAVPLIVCSSHAGRSGPERRKHWDGGGRMRRLLLKGCLCALAVLSAAACTIPPAPGSSATLPAQVLPADARALVYGRTVSEVIQSPELRDKIPGLFGADWMPASQGRGQLALG